MNFEINVHMEIQDHGRYQTLGSKGKKYPFFLKDPTQVIDIQNRSPMFIFTAAKLAES